MRVDMLLQVVVAWLLHERCAETTSWTRQEVVCVGYPKPSQQRLPATSSEPASQEHRPPCNFYLSKFARDSTGTRAGLITQSVVKQPWWSASSSSSSAHKIGIRDIGSPSIFPNRLAGIMRSPVEDLPAESATTGTTAEATRAVNSYQSQTSPHSYQPHPPRTYSGDHTGCLICHEPHAVPTRDQK